MDEEKNPENRNMPDPDKNKEKTERNADPEDNGLDEALEESFPASDPPAYSRKTPGKESAEGERTSD
jgi:hypothetical protein